MAKADIEKTVNADRKWFWKAITDYESYPRFVKGCSSVSVKREGNVALVSYRVNLIKEVEYVLRHVEDEAAGRLSWTLESSKFMKKNEGQWRLGDAGPGKTNARYELEVDFSFPAPGFVVSKLIKSNLPELVSDMEKHAREIQAKEGKS